MSIWVLWPKLKHVEACVALSVETKEANAIRGKLILWKGVNLVLNTLESAIIESLKRIKAVIELAIRQFRFMSFQYLNLTQSE